MSNLAGSVGAVIGQVQSELYDEVVERGWFVRRPDSTRNRYALLGWIVLAAALVITIVLVATSRFGLAGLALIATALGLVFLAQDMPARTAKGTGVTRGPGRSCGATCSPSRWGRSRRAAPTRRCPSILPYAIVLGGKERWLQAIADSDEDETPDPTDLDWYHGPEGWHLDHLPASLANFITTVQGTLFSR
ncbi:MAG: hypothetical protein QM779_16990 [Propionicimonas sp.]|uniref:hypothetical protein n=1 Tax=Propionicimonas sp. TaxID=1955623 RepID=UPI003D152463